ncbi:hypothetical protein JKF63_01623 [Porcisia hertigi]|uniref:RIIa domain-containing protein n=1 Tax=Porcisia hertigi TaxID=2761500 RepID=A0A836L095_9TRYP|nr:hypothetical protein JKF63_01623 [Porcisia hertigi]
MISPPQPRSEHMGINSDSYFNVQIMADAMTTALMAEPTLEEAAVAVFNEKECMALKSNLRSEQIAQAKYLRAHPEIHKAVQEGLSRVLLAQPKNPLDFLIQYFASEEFLDLQHQ